jgi:Na+-transporting NADH:ubiquinone oxidoreductase subunit NqrF
MNLNIVKLQSNHVITVLLFCFVTFCRANEHPKFPEGGKMSQHLDSLAVGDSIDVKGPVGHFVYEGRGKFSLNRKPGFAK